MKKRITKKEMIDTLVAQVNYLELEDLIDLAQSLLRKLYNKASYKEVKFDYDYNTKGD